MVLFGLDTRFEMVRLLSDRDTNVLLGHLSRCLHQILIEALQIAWGLAQVMPSRAVHNM